MVLQRIAVYGNQMAMWMRKRTSLGLILALILVNAWGCASRVLPVTPAGVVLQPGRYLTAFYRAPEFSPAGVTYALNPFPVEAAQGFPGDTFRDLFMEELIRAWRANGLQVSPQGAAAVSGLIQYVAIRGAVFRFLRGKVDAQLEVSGAITRGEAVLFAFQDRITLSSPVNPGPPAPKEDELLLRQTARTFAAHLLNELLLYWPPVEGR